MKSITKKQATELCNKLDCEGFHYGLTQWEWDHIKDESFQSALKQFKEASNTIETFIETLRTKFNISYV